MAARPPIQRDHSESGVGPGPHLSEPEADRYTRRLIRHRAGRLVHQIGLNPADRQDVEQDLWVDLVARWRRFDATRAGGRTFAARVVEHQVTKLFHKSQAANQDAERNGRSLEEPVADGAGHTVPLASTLRDGAQRLRDGHAQDTSQGQSELAIDVAMAVAHLPAELRDLCERLKECSIADVARDLGVTRTWVYRRLEKVRAHFVSAGLHEYFGIPPDTFPGAGVCKGIGAHNDTEAKPMQTTADNLGSVIREPQAIYREKAKEYLTSHALADFRRCPLLYHKRKLGLVEDEDRPAYLVGRALHTLVLEGAERFEQEYAVGGPINPKTGEPYGANTKAFAEWAASLGKEVLTDAQFQLVLNMAEGVRAHQTAMELLSSGIPEGVVRANYCGVPCQVRIDWMDPHVGIVDVKTADSLDYFEADARRYGYVYQVAFYRAVLQQVLSIPMPAYFIGVEKKEPFRCGVWRVDGDALAQAQRENEAAIYRLKLCMESDTWPTGYAEVRVFDAM